MKYIQIFDFIRHLFEFFFFLVTGPLVTAAAFKKITKRKSDRDMILELQRKIEMLEENETKRIDKIENK